MRKVDFFIVGAPKCGTTSMYYYLRSHPQIFMPDRKEPHFFGSDLDFRDRTRLTLQEYQKLFMTARPDQKIGEASVFYLYSKLAAAEIREYNKRARIIIMLRSPIDMLYSLHSQRLYNGTEDIEDFQVAIDAQNDRKRGRRLPRRLGLVQGLFYFDVANYVEQVERYLVAFGREQVHVIIYDDFSRDIATSYHDLCRFLGIHNDDRTDFEVVNQNKIARARWLSRLLWRPTGAIRKIARTIVPNSDIRRNVSTIIRQVNTISCTRDPLDVKLRKRLSGDLSPSVMRLGEILQRDLTHWVRYEA